MNRLIVFMILVVLMLSLAAPAFAVNGSGGAGREFGAHHAEHARTMGGFTGDENPGMHRGFAGWIPEY